MTRALRGDVHVLGPAHELHGSGGEVRPALRELCCTEGKVSERNADRDSIGRSVDLGIIEIRATDEVRHERVRWTSIDVEWRSGLHDCTFVEDDHLIAIGRFFPSSKTCGACGLVNADLTLTDRDWTCRCGVQHDRDLNAATNIDREGMRLFEDFVAAGYAETQNACGDVGSPIARLAHVDEARSPIL